MVNNHDLPPATHVSDSSDLGCQLLELVLRVWYRDVAGKPKCISKTFNITVAHNWSICGGARSQQGIHVGARALIEKVEMTGRQKYGCVDRGRNAGLNEQERGRTAGPVVVDSIIG